MNSRGLPLVLASTSASRRELLARLGLPFEAVSPAYEEATAQAPTPAAVALERARGKAASVAPTYPGRLVVGSDQVAEVGGVRLGKPRGLDGAVEQLSRMAGRWVTFHTGLALRWDGREEAVVEAFRVRLRPLTRGEIECYVAAERPLGAAGSFLVEGLGIALMSELKGRDFTALIGLPLIALTGLLSRFGVAVLDPAVRAGQLNR